MASYIVDMTASSHVPERRRTPGPPVAHDDWRALRRSADLPVDRMLHDLDDGLARLDRRLADIRTALKAAASAS